MEQDNRGVRIGNETADIISESASIRPLRDQIILEPLEWRPSEIIRIAYSGRPVRGVVKAIGPGHYPKIYEYEDSKGWKGYDPNQPQRRKVRMRDSKVFNPTKVKVGDLVELGGIELGTGALRGYAFQSFLWGTKEHLICSERDVTGIVE